MYVQPLVSVSRAQRISHAVILSSVVRRACVCQSTSSRRCRRLTRSTAGCRESQSHEDGLLVTAGCSGTRHRTSIDTNHQAPVRLIRKPEVSGPGGSAPGRCW